MEKGASYRTESDRAWHALQIFTDKLRKSRGKLQMRLQAKRRRSKPTLTRHFMD